MKTVQVPWRKMERRVRVTFAFLVPTLLVACVAAVGAYGLAGSPNDVGSAVFQMAVGGVLVGMVALPAIQLLVVAATGGDGSNLRLLRDTMWAGGVLGLVVGVSFGFVVAAFAAWLGLKLGEAQWLRIGAGVGAFLGLCLALVVWRHESSHGSGGVNTPGSMSN